MQKVGASAIEVETVVLIIKGVDFRKFQTLPEGILKLLSLEKSSIATGIRKLNCKTDSKVFF